MDVDWEDKKEEIVVQYNAFSQKGGWVIEVATIIGVAVVLTLFLGRLLRSISSRPYFQRSVWRHTGLNALSAPLLLMVWAVAGNLVFRDLYKVGCLSSGQDVCENLFHLLLVFAIGWWLLRWNLHVEKVILERVRTGQATFEVNQVAIVSKLVTITIVVVTLLLGLDALDVDIRALLTLGGIGGIAIGFAGKDVFSNFFSGFMIFMTRPFSVGNWIRSPDKDIEGTVEHIGWYLTQIRSFDKRPIYVPNSLFSTIVVVNPSRMTNRRIRHELSIRYCDLPLAPKIIEEMTAYIKGHAALDPTQKQMVYLSEFGDSGLGILVYCFSKTTDWSGWLAVQQEVLLGLADIVIKHGAEFAFTTQTLDLPEIKLRMSQRTDT